MAGFLGDYLCRHLATNAVIAERVEERIYPVIAQQGCKFPAIVYVILNTEPTQSHQGFSGLHNFRVQIISFAEKYKDAHEVADAVLASLDAFQGTQWDGAEVGAITIEEAGIDGYEEAIKVYGVSQAYTIPVNPA